VWLGIAFDDRGRPGKTPMSGDAVKSGDATDEDRKGLGSLRSGSLKKREPKLRLCQLTLFADDIAKSLKKRTG
jgi:hypothetical protein